ncbi:MBL fold metallo-hydrolase [Devosia ginsengisoli]|uniref:MBL fold metallo-hydrolase n=1 Tax=Devosia ginsengisoli TaxID=400770 RepID=UPI0026ED17D7|nr:MBL fold metallo-hydrolase [Devosia ginsengisoli]MCR6672611.1 MBL fold metallo-hydrolase [Devosia ginsengisoli]
MVFSGCGCRSPAASITSMPGYVMDRRGWTVIDCGMNSAETRAVWDRTFETTLASRGVGDILVTHGHVDHVGYLGTLAERSGATVWMSLAEYLTAGLRITEPEERTAEQANIWLAWCGCPTDEGETIIANRIGVRSNFVPLPVQYRRLQTGDSFLAGGASWEVRAFGGHAPEMITLFDPGRHLLIAADQVLSHITPSITVHPGEPYGDPLQEFFASFDVLAQLPADTLVLPSHGAPFYGLHERLAQLRSHHEARLDQVEATLDTPQTAYAVALMVFARAMAGSHARQALSETLAHLNYLQRRGRVVTSLDDNGAARFART